MQGAPVQPGSWHAAFGTVDWQTNTTLIDFDGAGGQVPGVLTRDWSRMTLQSLTGESVWVKKAGCSCQCSSADCATEQCFGPALRSGLEGWEVEEIRGKPWAVFVHGGVFRMFNGIDANYAQVTFSV